MSGFYVKNCCHKDIQSLLIAWCNLWTLKSCVNQKYVFRRKQKKYLEKFIVNDPRNLSDPDEHSVRCGRLDLQGKGGHVTYRFRARNRSWQEALAVKHRDVQIGLWNDVIKHYEKSSKNDVIQFWKKKISYPPTLPGFAYHDVIIYAHAISQNWTSTHQSDMV